MARYIKLGGLLFLALIYCGAGFSQAGVKCPCPLTKGAILTHEDRNEWGKRIPQVEIKGKEPLVYSSLEGVINSIDSSVGNSIVISVQSDTVIFIYDNLMETTWTQGEKIKAGELLGQLRKGENLLLRAMNDSGYVNIEKLLSCKRKSIKK